MAYKTDEIRGEFREGLNIVDSFDGKPKLYEWIKDEVIVELKEQNVAVTIKEDQMKSGGMFGSKAPLLVISHPDSSRQYFDLAVCVNGSFLSFWYLGESKENTKANKKKFYQENGNHFKAAMIKVDNLALQQEEAWSRKVIDCIETVLNIMFEPR